MIIFEAEEFFLADVKSFVLAVHRHDHEPPILSLRPNEEFDLAVDDRISFILRNVVAENLLDLLLTLGLELVVIALVDDFLPQILVLILEVKLQRQVLDRSRQAPAMFRSAVVDQRNLLAVVSEARQQIRQMRTAIDNANVGVTEFLIAKVLQRAVDA